MTLAEAAYEKALDDDELAAAALRQVARLERQRDEQRRTLQEAEAVASEWQGALDAGAGARLLRADRRRGRGHGHGGEGRRGVERRPVDGDRGDLDGASRRDAAIRWTLQAEFQLRPPSGLPMVSGLAEALAVDAAGRRIALPQGVEEPSEAELVRRSLASKPDHSLSSTVAIRQACRCPPSAGRRHAGRPTRRRETRSCGFLPSSIRRSPHSWGIPVTACAGGVVVGGTTDRVLAARSTRSMTMTKKQETK